MEIKDRRKCQALGLLNGSLKKGDLVSHEKYGVCEFLGIYSELSGLAKPKADILRADGEKIKNVDLSDISVTMPPEMGIMGLIDEVPEDAVCGSCNGEGDVDNRICEACEGEGEPHAFTDFEQSAFEYHEIERK